MSQAPEKEVLEVGTHAGSPSDPAEHPPADFQRPHALPAVQSKATRRALLLTALGGR